MIPIDDTSVNPNCVVIFIEYKDESIFFLNNINTIKEHNL